MKTFGKICAKHPELHGERYQRHCVQCKKDLSREYTSKHWRKYWQANREAWKRNSAKWKSKNKERVAVTNAAWERRNRSLRNMRLATRRASQKCATPLWADMASIASVYADAADLTSATGVKHNVDHIVPLVSPVVCGLHVQNNLRVVTQYENYSKGNRRWPDMPEGAQWL